MRKKLLSILLAVLMVLVMVPTMVFAEEPLEYSVTINATNKIGSGIDSDGTHFDIFSFLSDGNGWYLDDANDTFSISSKGNEKIKRIEFSVNSVTHFNLSTDQLIASPSGTFTSNNNPANIDDGDIITLSFENPVSSVQIVWIDQEKMSWIQLESAKIFYEEENSNNMTVSDILPNDFPTALTDGWLNNKGNGYKAFLSLDDNTIKIADKDGLFFYQCPTQAYITPKGNNYEVNLSSTTVTFIMTNNVLTGIEFSYDESIDSLPYHGVYVPHVTIADILGTVDGFPATEENGWPNSNDSSIKAYIDSDYLMFIKDEFGISTLEELSKVGSDYEFYGDAYTLTFKMNASGSLDSIVVSGLKGEYSSLNGTYKVSKYEGYEIIQGNEVTINVSDSKDVLFTSNADFSKFKEVKVDNKTVAEKHYKAESGSTEVTLKASYLSALANGKHTLEIVSSDGFASTTFTITRNNKPSPNPGYIVPNTSVK